MGGPPVEDSTSQFNPDRQRRNAEAKKQREEDESLKKQQEAETKLAEEAANKERDLAPLNKALRDEVDFLNKKFISTSKIGGRGLF